MRLSMTVSTLSFVIQRFLILLSLTLVVFHDKRQAKASKSSLTSSLTYSRMAQNEKYR